MKVLFATSEFADYAKAGGLGEGPQVFRAH